MLDLTAGLLHKYAALALLPQLTAAFCLSEFADATNLNVHVTNIVFNLMSRQLVVNST
jgi:hypothetical protein